MINNLDDEVERGWLGLGMKAQAFHRQNVLNLSDALQAVLSFEMQ